MWALPVLLGVVGASALGLRRWPLPALAVLLGGSLAVILAGSVPSRLPQSTPLIAMLAVLICAVALEVCYLTAAHSRQVSLTGLALVGVSLLTGLLAAPATSDPFGYGGVKQTEAIVSVPVVLVTAVAWLIGYSVRAAQDRAELVQAQAALAERLRIARELHDMVAHSIGIIAIQAGAGRRVFDASPAQARDALAAIEATSRETLAGLRRMVTGLRRAEPELSPAPGLADLDQLAALTLEAGVRVDVDWPGRGGPLPADIDLAAFRIVQEAVTNVVRHAGTGQCRVSIAQQDGQLSIEVTDRGRGGDPAGAGFGITGMRERAALLGGDLSAGPHADGGFRVTARLPLPATAR